MKEFYYKIDNHLSVGLRRNFRENLGTPSAEKLKNLEPSVYGLTPFEYPRMPWTEEQLNQLGITLHWPFPQLLKLTSVTLLVGWDYIFLVNEYDLSLTQITTYNYYSPDNQMSIIGGGIWKSIDFYNTWMLSNGQCSLWWDDELQKLLVEPNVKFNAAVEYKGRGMFGGFDPVSGWSPSWLAYWSGASDMPRPLGWNWISWTHIGNSLRDLIDANVTQLKLLRNDAGSYPLRARETVVDLIKFGGRVVAFTLDTVSIFSHKSNPASTIAPDKQNISSGILNSGAVAAGRDAIVYVDEQYRLWVIGKDFNPTLLGYQEWIKKMAGKQVIVSYNDLNSSFYISDGEYSYVLTWNETEDKPQGLCSTPQVITSYASISGKMCNLGTDLNDKKWEYQTSAFDMGRPGLKSLRWLGFFGQEGVIDVTSGTIYFKIFWRDSIHSSWKESVWKKVNKNGMAYFPVSGMQFKIALRGDDLNQIDLSYIQVTYQNEDYRYTRGIDVTKTNQ